MCHEARTNQTYPSVEMQSVYSSAQADWANLESKHDNSCELW